MLFTPSSPISSPSESSSVGSESSPTHTSSVGKARYVGNQSYAIALSNNSTLVTNGPENNRLLSTSPTRLSQLSDQEWFYSPLSSSSSSRPSIQLTPTKTITPSPLPTRRLDSPATVPIQKKARRFRFPTSSKLFTRHAPMNSIPTTTTTTASTPSNPQDTLHLTTTGVSVNFRPASMPIPVVNPMAAAALVDDIETIIVDEHTTKSFTSSPSTTPRTSTHLHRSPTDYMTNVYQSLHRKVILNVGGVRHEGKFGDLFRR
jgi:hypothetical protein